MRSRACAQHLLPKEKCLLLSCFDCFQQMPHVQTHAVQTWLNDRYVTTKKPADGRVDLSNIDWSDSLMDNTLQRRWQHFIYSARSWIPIGSIK